MEKRKRYDMYGTEEHQHISRNGRTFESGFSRGFDDQQNVTAEELFNMFFGGGAFTSQNVYSSRSRRFNRQPETEEREQGYTALFNLIPILLLIILSGMSSFFISDPIYNLSPSV